MALQRAPHVSSEHFQAPLMHSHVLHFFRIVSFGWKTFPRSAHGHISGWTHLPALRNIPTGQKHPSLHITFTSLTVLPQYGSKDGPQA